MTKAKKATRATRTRAVDARNAPIEAAKPAALAEPQAEPARYTWEQLAAKIAAPSEAEAKAFAVTVSTAELTKQGATVRSERILTDGRRWLGQIYPYWSKLTPVEKTDFIGFSDARLRVLFAQFVALKEAVAKNSAAPSHAADFAKVVAQAEATYKRGQLVRARIVRALTQAALSDPSLKAQVDAANTAAQDAAQLAKTLRAVIDVARGAVAHTLTGVQLTHDGLSPARLDELSKLVVELESAAGIGGKAGGKPVSQSEVDRLDGICLLAMQSVRSVFAAAQEEDPRVPTLVPLATRSVFGLSSGHGTDEQPAPSPEDPAKR